MIIAKNNVSSINYIKSNIDNIPGNNNCGLSGDREMFRLLR